MIFSDELSVIQDRISRSLIGVGELRLGVFCFSESTTMKVQANAVASYTLWHSRLGHPSNYVFSMLPKELGVGSSFDKNKLDVCDICLRAKQTRTPFDIIESNASNLFEIIRCDIWDYIKFLLFVDHITFSHSW